MNTLDASCFAFGRCLRIAWATFLALPLDSQLIRNGGSDCTIFTVSMLTVITLHSKSSE